jgi:uncharacterized protein YjbI with pentapeptide repeats
MPSKKVPADPAAPDLPGELVARDMPEELIDLELEARLLGHLDLSSRDARGLRLTESRLVDVDLTASFLGRARIRDVVWLGGSMANLRAEAATFRRVRLERVRATGVNLTTCHLEDVTFIDCRMDLAMFRFAHLDRVRFERCRMSEADFYEATLTSVVFEDTELTSASLAGATFDRSEMRGCDLSGVADPQRLRGVRMPWLDVIRSARELAEAAGINIIE